MKYVNSRTSQNVSNLSHASPVVTPLEHVSENRDDDDDDDDDNNAHRWRANAHPMRHARADARRCDAKKDGE
jgi:hypothetical protein